ncbi:hypothetical protein [Corynebacterium hindlerae]|uniref:VG15 protein n=1 Tax=Corynebacterium hindlerae TaxID=699041 RepID=UPI003AABF977
MSAQDEYSLALDYLRILVQKEFAQWWTSLGVSPMNLPYSTIEAVFADLIAKYGEQSAAAAVDYLVLSRSLDDDLAKLPFPDLADPVGFEQVSASMSWAMHKVRSASDVGERAAELQLARAKLDGILARLVTKPGTDTVVRNVLRDGTAFARVPEPGACSFCLMLASRGAVYTEKTVGRVNKFHDSFRCLGIEVKRDGSDLPRINRDLEREWGLLSDHLGRVPNVVDLERHMRQLKEAKKWPPLERIKVPAYKGDGKSVAFPGEDLPRDLNRLVAHAVYGWRDRPRKGEKDYPHNENIRMGHTADSMRDGASKFPADWSDQRIANAIVETLEHPEFAIGGEGRNQRMLYKNVDGVLVKVEYTRIGGKIIESSLKAFPVDHMDKRGLRRVN